MTWIAEALEATELAAFLKRSRWVYPLVNAGHIFGIALLVGSVVPMDLRLLGLRRAGTVGDTLTILRPIAAAGFVLAAIFGTLLFVTQASDYAENRWFQAKLALIALALVNVLVHLRLAGLPHPRRRVAALLSLMLWPAVLILGRMIGYS